VDSTGGGQRHTVRDAPTTIAVSDSGGRVYIAPQVDRQVIRDPSSAAPAYPESLRTHGVEGSATVKFIVDTTGYADSGSFRIVTATNLEFAEAIRAALPNMRFEPAMLADHTVRQLVQQEFRFVLTHPDTVPTRGRKRRS
jgi:TonB family protein